MISYDNYKNRIEKLAKFKRILHKFRFLICGVLALIVGTSVGLMCAKGAYMSDMTLSAQTVRFNEYYEVTAAKAFLASSSEQHIEYRGEEGGWTSEKPVKAGKYSARTVTKKIVGYSYSSAVNFEILPIDAQFSITGTSMTYGDVGNYSIPQLVSGHRVDESALVFEYAEYGAASTEVNVDVNSIRIIDRSGDDFTSCYNITTAGKTLAINPRSITVTPAAYEFTYDAKAHNSGGEVTDETRARLAGGDTLTVTTAVGGYTDGAVDAGNYTVQLESVKIMHGGNDVTDWYNVSRGSSQFTINRRPLTITTGDKVKVYDGTPAENTVFDSENLIEGHTATVDRSTLCRDTDVGTYKNLFGVTVSDGTTDVSRNYEVKCNAGTLTITHAKLTVTTGTPAAAHTYDGTPFGYYYFDVAETLSAGFNITAVESLSHDTTDAGVYDNDFKVAVTLNGGDVTNNFDISYVCGKLTVLKRDLTVTTVGDTKVYDGKPLTYADFGGDNLAENQRLKEVKSFSVTDVTAADGVEIAAQFTVVDFAGRDVGKNYDIGYENGKLIITPRHIVVTTNSKTKEYDGAPLFDDGYTTDIAGGALYNGDKLVLKGSPAQITEKGYTDNANDYTVPSANYVIDEIVYGTLTVEPKKMTVTVSDVTAVYGEEIIIPDSSFDLINGETLTFNTHFERGGTTCEPETWHGYTLLDRGIYSIVPDADKKVTGGNAKLSNYDITYVNGTLEITQRVIYYVTADAEKVYDGTYLQNTDYTTYLAADNTKAGLLGDSDELSLRPDITRILGVERRLNINYYDCPANYIINTEMSRANFGWLEITPRPIIVYTGSATKPYDGTPLTCGDYTVKYASEVGGKWVADDSEVGLVTREDTGIRDTLTLKGNAVSITNAGEAENASKYANGNYDIKDCVDGTLKVEKYVVEIGLGKYDGSVLYYGYRSAITEGSTDSFIKDGESVTNVLVNGEKLTVYYKFRQNGGYVTYKNAGTYTTVAYKYVIRDAENLIIENGENNYEITCANGETVISPLKVTVDIDDKTVAYGEKLPENSVKYFTHHFDDYINVEKLSFDEILIPDYVYDPANPKEAGMYDITANSGKVYDENGALIAGGENNYEITYIGGTLTIERRTLYIGTASASKTYDGTRLIAKNNPTYYSLDAEGQKIRGLAEGHALIATFIREVTNATVDEEGNITPVVNDTRYKIVDGDGIDVSDKYDIIYLPDGTLTITRAPLTIKFWYNTITIRERIYYGTKWSYPTGPGNYKEKKDSASGLVNGEEIEFVVYVYSEDAKDYVDTPVNAGRYTIGIDRQNSKIYSADGNEIENGIRNYTFTSVMAGHLTVESKPITITFAGNAVEYGDDLTDFIPAYTTSLDGNMPYNESFEIGGFTYLADGEEAPEKKDAGEYEINGKDLVFYDGDGNEIENGESNYNITYKGVLTVNKKQVHIRFKDETLKYGREDQLQGFATQRADFVRTDGSTDPALAYGEVLWITTGYKKDGKALDYDVIGGFHRWRLSVGDYTRYAVEYFIIENEDSKQYIDQGLELKNYEIICEEGALEITPYTVTVKPNDQTCVYGTPEDEIEDTGFEYTDSWTISHGGLPYGEELILSYSYDPSPITNVGEYKINATATGVEDGDLKNYTVRYEDGTLTVTRKFIKVRILDDEVTYGEELPQVKFKPLNYDDHTDCTMPYGDVLQTPEFVYSVYGSDGSPLVTPRNAGEYWVQTLRFSESWIVKDINGYDVTANYAIQEWNGKLTVNKKTVTVELNTIASVYYGDTFTYAAGADNYANFNTIQLAYNERLEVAVEYLIDGVVGTPKDVNYEDHRDLYYFAYSARLNDKGCVVYEADGETVIEDGTDNYVFDCDDLENLQIMRRTVYVYLLDYTEEYGNFAGYEDYVGNYKRVEYKDGETRVEGAPYDEQFKVNVEYFDVDGNSVEYPKNVGTYKIKFYGAEVYDSDGALMKLGSNNYGFATAEPYCGTLEIVPKDIRIALSDIEVEYGKFSSSTYPDAVDNYDLVHSTPLAYEEQIKVSVKYQQSVDGKIVDVTPKNVGSYIIAGVDYAVYDGGKSADKNNYSVSYEAGTLTIHNVALYIDIEDNSCTYGDELPEHTYKITDYRFKEYTLPYGDKFEILNYSYWQDRIRVTPRNAGTYEVYLGTYSITNGEDDVSDNYAIAFSTGKLTIEKADLEITLPDVTGITYGDEWTYPYEDCQISGLKYNETIKIAVKYFDSDGNFVDEPKNAGTYTVVLDEDNCEITNEDGSAGLLSNYEIDCEEVEFNIAKRAITVYLKADKTNIYYGDDLPEVTFTISEDGNEGVEYTLPNNDEITFGYRYLNLETNEYETPKNAGTYQVEIEKTFVNGVLQTGGNGNYAVGYYDVWITIRPYGFRPVINDFSVVYGNEIPYYFGASAEETEKLPYGEKVIIEVRYLNDEKEVTPVNVGVYDIEIIEYTVYDKDGNEIENSTDNYTDNYGFYPELGQMTIVPLEVTITVDDLTATYGEDISALENGFTVDTEMPFGEVFELSYSCSIDTPNAGEYENAVTATVVGVTGGNADLDNYDITEIIAGKLTVTPRELTVKVTGGTAVYGDENLPEIKHEITAGKMVGEEVLVPAYVFSLNGTECDPINAGIYDITVDEANTTVEGGNALYANYKVTYVYDGKLVITPAPLTVEIIGDSFTYGERKANVTFEITDGALYYDDQLELTYAFDGKTEEPTAAGTYEITATAAIVGGNARVENYDIPEIASVTLTILQREIEITLDTEVNSFAYGDDFDGEICAAAIVGGALEGHTVKIAVTYASKTQAARALSLRARAIQGFTPKAVGGYIATLDFDNCTVVDQNGNSVEGGIGNYKLKANAEPLEFEITPMTLTVTVENAQRTYGDKLPTALDYGVAEKMPYGERLELSFSFKGEDGKLPVHADTYPVKVTAEIPDGDIGNYELVYTNGTPELTISPKAVKIRVSDLVFPYGSSVVYKIEANNYDVYSSGSLIDGDELTVTGVSYVGGDGTEYTAENPPRNAGEYDVIFESFSVVNAEGEDATDDYSVTKQNGTLTIKSGVIIIYTSSAEKEYDGTPLSTESYDSYEGELFGYSLVADENNICEQIDATEGDGVDNTTEFIIVDENGVETDNLELRYGADNATYGKLKVTKRRIEIKSNSAVKDEYDGIALTADYEVIYKGTTEGGAPIAARDTFKVTGTGEQIDAGESENTVYYTLTNSGNYEIETNFGRLKVLPKYVEVTIDRISAVYGVQPEITFTTDVPLADGETLSFGVGYFKGLDRVEPATDGGYFILPVGTYAMYYENGTAAIDGGRSNVENYVFTFVPAAELKVTKRHIAITTATDSAGYDGTEFFNYEDYTTVWVVDGVRQGEVGLLGEDTLDMVSYTKLTDFGSVPNVCEYSVSGNYEIEEDMYGYGTLTVTARLITVKTEDVIATYDGKPHSGGKLTDVYDKLVAGHTLKAASELVAPVDVTDGVRNVIEVKIEDENGDDVTANYSIKRDVGTIIIKPRPLEITTGGVSGVTYDGEAHGNTVYEKADGLLTELGHELVVEKEFTQTNATAGVGNKTAYRVYCDGKDLTGNYNINYLYGTIVIDKKPVTVTLNGGVQVEYGDNSYTAKLTENAVTLVNGETAKIAIETDRTVGGVGTYTATADWANTVIRSSNGRIIKDGAKNYEPEYVPASVGFEVIPREIEVTLNAGGKTRFTYGEDYDSAIRTVVVDGAVAGETLIAAVTYSEPDPKYVGTYTAELDKDGCTVDGGDIANYDIVLCNGVTFEIVARELTVYMKDITVGYGEPLGYPEGESGIKSVAGLVDGDALTLVIPAFEKDGDRVTPNFAGTYDIVCDGIEINGGAVAAENYNIITGKPYGKLNITGVGIEIVRKTVTKTYDGQPLELDKEAPEEEVGYVINGNESLKLPDGYRLMLDGEFATADGNVASSCANIASYKVLNADGEEAGEYVVTHQSNDAKLIIEKKVINVTTGGAKRDYDGTELTADPVYNAGDLVSGHTLGFVSRASLTNVGNIPNDMVLKVMSGSENVTANYDIRITETGTLIVEALSVTVDIADIQKVYGEDINVNSFALTYALPVNGETLSFRVLYTLGDERFDGTTLLNVGTYGIIADPANNMSVVGGNHSVDNYDFTFAETAELKITERHIIVTTADETAEYSGLPLTKTDGYTTVWVVDGESRGVAGLVNGDVLTVDDGYASQTEIGSCENVCTYSVSGNYVIDGYVYGTLTVTKIALSVTTNGITGEYRGTPYSDGGFTYDGNILAGHVVELTGELPEFLDATNSGKNKFDVVVTAGDEDVSGYYDISYNCGDVVITKRALTVTLNGGQTVFEYGDGSFDGKFKNVTAEGLVADDELTTVALTYSAFNGNAPVNVGSYTAKLDLTNSFIEYAGEGNGIGNYNITCADLDFEITRKAITITLGEWAAEEYDGNAHSYDVTRLSVPDGALTGGDALVNITFKYCSDTDGLVTVGTPKDAGTYYVFLDLSATKVRSATSQTAVSTNYDVTCAYVTHIITPKQLVVTLSDVSHVYDGTAYEFGEDGFTADVCAGDKVKCNVTYDKTPVNVDEYTVTFESLVFTSGSAENYGLDLTASTLTCKLTIEKRVITVTVADRNVERGHEEYTKSDLSSQAADGGAGFVAGDLEKATATFSYTDKLPLPKDTVAYKTVSVTFGGDVMDNYSVEKVNEGTLTVTERKVLVTPVFNGAKPYVYDGNAVDISLFGYTHAHNVAGAAADDKYGFTAEDAAKFTATYTFRDAKNNVVDGTPVNAGTYTVSVAVSGEGYDGYCVEYKKLTFKIEMRPLSYTVAVEGAGEYVYSNSRPAFTAELKTYDGFVNGVVPAHTFELFSGDSPVTRYNVGTYEVKLAFAGMENYDVSATTAQIKITRRTIVVTPVDPFDGVAQEYKGSNLKLGSTDFEVTSSGMLENGDLAVGDVLTIASTAFAPTSASGTLSIAEVNIVSGGVDVSQNYTVYYQYNAVNQTIKKLGLLKADFQVRVSYARTTVEYELGDVGGSYPYTGSTRTHSFDTNAVSLADGEELKYGHEIRLSRGYVTVPAAADDYPDLITALVKVYDASGNDVSAIYVLECVNSANGLIKVTENVLDVGWAGLKAENLTVGKLDLEVSGLFGGANPAHQAEVYAYDIDGEWIIGITVFSINKSGKKTDLSGNYKLDESCTLDGATVKIITTDEADNYSNPAIGVTITVTEEALEKGKGTLYTFDEKISRWVLNGGYTVTDEDNLQEGHKLRVLVFRQGGKFLLGVSICSESGGTRSDVSGSYRLRDLVKSDVAAEYVTYSAEADLQREIYIDFSTCTIEEGVISGYTYEGLSEIDKHRIEVTVTVTDGRYVLNVAIYRISSGRKFNMSTRYELKATLPDGVTAELLTGSLN